LDSLVVRLSLGSSMAPFRSNRQDHKLLTTAGLLILATASSVGIYRLASNIPSIGNAVILATTANATKALLKNSVTNGTVCNHDATDIADL
jgi:hypothetical protein